MRSNSRSTITICIILSIFTICLITTSKAQNSKPAFIRFLRRYHKPKHPEEHQVRYLNFTDIQRKVKTENKKSEHLQEGHRSDNNFEYPVERQVKDNKSQTSRRTAGNCSNSKLLKEGQVVYQNSEWTIQRHWQHRAQQKQDEDKQNRKTQQNTEN